MLLNNVWYRSSVETTLFLHCFYIILLWYTHCLTAILHRKPGLAGLPNDSHIRGFKTSFYRLDALSVTQPTASKHWRMTVFLTGDSMLPPRCHGEPQTLSSNHWMTTAVVNTSARMYVRYPCYAEEATHTYINLQREAQSSIARIRGE